MGAQRRTIVTEGTPPEPAPSALVESGKQRPDVRQTWDWADAEASVVRAEAGVLVTELLVAGWPAQDRVNALTRVVAALARWTPPVLVWWPHSQKVTDPDTLALDDVNGIVNVRFFTVAGDDGAMVLNTSGRNWLACRDCRGTSGTGTP